MEMQRVRHDLLPKQQVQQQQMVHVPFLRWCQEAQLALYFLKVISVSLILESLLIVVRGLIC